MTDFPVILIGAGGHAKVLLDILFERDVKIIGVCDPDLEEKNIKEWRSIKVLGNDDAVFLYNPNEVMLVNGIGSLPNNKLRKKLYEYFSFKGYRFKTIVHSSVILGKNVNLDEGVQLMAGCVIQADTNIGCNSIINTSSCIDHDVNIGRYVHIAPGAVLSGGISIADDVHIGPGAVLIQGLNIGEGSVVGAGTTVIKNIPAFHQQIGQSPRQPKAF